MNLMIDSFAVQPKPDQSLLDIVKELGLVTGKLSEDPLVAKIAGEVFTLNYIPVRQKDAQPDRISIRRAMAASEGKVHLVRYTDPAGKDAYVRTAQFVLFLALERLWPNSRAKMNCTVGAGLFIEVNDAEDFDVQNLKQEVSRIVAEDIPLLRRRVTTREAYDHYVQTGREDKARLLAWRQSENFDLYSYGEFQDYYYGEMAPSTGYLRVWDILPAEGGFMFVFPDDSITKGECLSCLLISRSRAAQ